MKARELALPLAHYWKGPTHQGNAGELLLEGRVCFGFYREFIKTEEAWQQATRAADWEISSWPANPQCKLELVSDYKLSEPSLSLGYTFSIKDPPCQSSTTSHPSPTEDRVHVQIREPMLVFLTQMNTFLSLVSINSWPNWKANALS